MHAYSEQFYTGYDVFPPNLNNWSGYIPQSHFDRYMSNAPVSDFFHQTAYPPDSSHDPMQQTYYHLYVSQGQDRNLSECKDDMEGKTSGNKESCDICVKADTSRTLQTKSSEQSTDVYSEKPGYATSDCEADTESVVGHADHLLTRTHTLAVKDHSSRSDVLQDDFDGTVADNDTDSSAETLEDTKKR